jgi:hypothetical protein
MKHKAIGLVVATILILCGCMNKNIQTTVIKDNQWINIDYENMVNWAAHPAKVDLADTLAVDSEKRDEKRVDVFFIHPTTLSGKLRDGYENAEITDEHINKKTDESPIRFQASVFNESCNVYAPRYRQAHLKMYDEKDSTKLHESFGKAYADVKSAFIYYMKNYNKGKPIIIASHSQGTTHARRLIKEMVDGREIQNRMIVAYLVGMPVLKNEFQNIKLCKDSIQTNCFVSWRTFHKSYKDDWANRLDTNIAVVNPVTWLTTNEIVEKEKHKGAVLYNLQKSFPRIQETQAEGSGVWISKPHFPGSILYNTKNYHVGDFNLFYIDIRENIKSRIFRYELTHQNQ